MPYSHKKGNQQLVGDFMQPKTLNKRLVLVISKPVNKFPHET